MVEERKINKFEFGSRTTQASDSLFIFSDKSSISKGNVKTIEKRHVQEIPSLVPEKVIGHGAFGK